MDKYFTKAGFKLTLRPDSASFLLFLRSDEEMVASYGEDLGKGDKKTGASLEETVGEGAQTDAKSVR